MVFVLALFVLIPVALIVLIIFGVVRAFSKKEQNNISNSGQYPLPEAAFPQTSPPISASSPYSVKLSKEKTHLQELKHSLGNGHNLTVIFCVILLCIFFVDIIYRTPGGFGSTLLFWSAELLILRLFTKKKNNAFKALLLSLPIFAISFSYTLFSDTKGYLIPYAVIITLILLQVVLLSGVELNEVFSFESIVLLLKRVLGTPLLNLDFFFGTLKLDKEKGSRKTRNLFYGILGVAFAIPFILLLLSLFFKADPIFKDGYEKVLKALKINITAERILVDILLGIFLSVFSGSALIYNYVETKSELPNTKQPKLNTVFGFAFTLVLNVVLAAFSFVQVKYLFFGGGNNPVLKKLGYAQYARQGFFELCIASGIVFTLAAIVIALCRREQKNPLYIRLSILFMSIFSGIIAISSLKRMLLYIGEYGLSIKRMNTIYGIFVILISLLWLFLKCIAGKFKALKVIGVSIIAVVTVFSFVNFDKTVSSYNTRKYIDSELYLDVKYISELSHTAIPDLVDLYFYLQSNKERYPVQSIDLLLVSIEETLLQRKSVFDKRPLFSYTFDDILISRAFDSVCPCLVK